MSSYLQRCLKINKKQQLFNKTTRKHNKVWRGVYEDKTGITQPLIFYILWFGCFTDNLKQKNPCIRR